MGTALGSSAVAVCVGATLGCGGVSTLASLARDESAGGPLGSGRGTTGIWVFSCRSGGSSVGSAGVKCWARWMSCFLVSVSVGDKRVECSLDRRAAVRSFDAATMVSSGVANGILKLCGNHFTVWAILARSVDEV